MKITPIQAYSLKNMPKVKQNSTALRPSFGAEEEKSEKSKLAGGARVATALLAATVAGNAATATAVAEPNKTVFEQTGFCGVANNRGRFPSCNYFHRRIYFEVGNATGRCACVCHCMREFAYTLQCKSEAFS